MKHFLFRKAFYLAVVVASLAMLISAAVPAATVSAQPAQQTWNLVWSDEFNGTSVNTSNWTFETGGGGWGNNELEYYTNGNNATVSGGILTIEARRESVGGMAYTSTRIKTQGKRQFTYGRLEGRLAVPKGQGIWPAFWMLGANIDQVGWPNCGEIDIMENIGREPAVNHGSLHGPGYSGGSPLTGIYTLPAGQKFADDFHTFAVEWEPAAVRFYVDGNLYHTKTPADAAGKQWVFDHPFFIILNVAVGGNFPGSPDDTTTFPQTLTVDYVRVYADDRFAPRINGVTSAKKHLVVSGDNFDNESVILMNGDPQKTLRDDVASGVLLGKKLAKRIPSGEMVKIRVRNGDGQITAEFEYVKP